MMIFHHILPPIWNGGPGVHSKLHIAEMKPPRATSKVSYIAFEGKLSWKQQERQYDRPGIRYGAATKFKAHQRMHQAS